MGILDKFSDSMSVVAEKVDDNKYLSVLKTTFTIFMPFAIAGSFSNLGRQLLTSEQSGLAQFSTFHLLTELDPAFSAISFSTMSIMTIIVVFILGMTLGKKNNQSEVFSAVVALSAYITLVPQGITSIVDGIEELQAGIPVTSVDASSLFSGMIITIIVVEFFCFLCKVERLKIKMPPTVPAAISKSFNTLIPIFITITTFGILGRVFAIITGAYINEFVYVILQEPMEVFFQNPFGLVAVTVLMQLFWIVGIHGGLVISPIRNPILMAALAANIAAFEAGEVPPNILGGGAWGAFILAGGSGLILSLIIAIFIASKKADDRMISKLGLIPAICGISEPVVFGLPLVLNPIFAIPFALGSGLAAAILFISHQIGFLIPAVVSVPFGIPVILNAFIGWGWRGIIVQLIIITAGVFLYLPFVLVANKQAKELSDDQEHSAAA